MTDVNLLIANKAELKRKIEKFNRNNFHVVSDFDGTLTKIFVNGKKIATSYAALRSGKYLTADYVQRSHALYDEYYPHEISEDLSYGEKSQKMQEWWQKHYDMMIECGMNKAIIKDIARNKSIIPRGGFFDFLSSLNSEKIPQLIFSAGQGNIIKEFFKMENILTPNVHLISNFYKFDDQGKVIGYTLPFIHTFNKNEVIISSTSYAKEIISRKNVLLLGDSLGDLKMTEGMDHAQVIRIGFLNENKEKFLKKYMQEFDVVITDDGSMKYVNEILNGIINDSQH